MPLQALRKFVRKQEAAEQCDTCGVALQPDHDHVLDLNTRRIMCACLACAPAFRRVPRRVLSLPDFRLSEGQWDALMIPIALAFFFHDSKSGGVVAQYPGPAGATESLLRLDSWSAIAKDNPVLKEMQPDVEALLINRVGATREYYVVPIDECYKLVGLIRTHWRGLSGGMGVWGEIARYFGELRARGVVCPA